MSALESVSFADLVPGGGCDGALELEFELMNRVKEWTASIDSHSVWPSAFLSAWEFWPPTIDEGNPGGVGGVLFCWVSAETTLSESFG